MNSHISPSQSNHSIKNLKEKTGKSRGSKIGHPGEILEMVYYPTHTIRYNVTRCERFGKDLSNTPVISCERRQVFDIPVIVCEVTGV